MLVEYVPPAYDPEYFSATPAPSKPTLPGSLTVKVAVAPPARGPQVCGNGVPEVAPSVAVLRVTLDAVAVPVFLTVMTMV